MPLMMHTVECLDQKNASGTFLPNRGDRLLTVLLSNVANAAGQEADSVVSTAIHLVDWQVPENYEVQIGAVSQQAVSYVSDKSQSGFTVNLQPLSGQTLAAGTFDVMVLA